MNTGIRVNIKTTNIRLTPELREHLEKQLQSFNKLIDPDDSSVICDVEIGRTTRHHQSGDIFRAEMNLHIAGKQLRAEAQEETLYNAIDRAKNEMMRELRRSKRKRIHLLRRSGAKMKELMSALGSRGARIKDILRRRK